MRVPYACIIRVHRMRTAIRAQHICYNVCVCARAGIDMPQCSLVVIFDLKRNVRAFIQSRGRARHVDSRLCVLANGDGSDSETLWQARLSAPHACHAVHIDLTGRPA